MSKRILLVEDEHAVREAIMLLLQLDGHAVTEAQNGQEALERFGKDRFDLVVTDFRMPGMKGNELAAAIKQVAPSQRILMVTAHDAPVPGPDNPVDEVLHKPFTLEELRRALDRAA